MLKLMVKYRSGYCGKTQVTEIRHDLLSSYYQNLVIDVAIVDVSNEFDTVLYVKLLHNLNLYSVKGPFHKFFTSFLTKGTWKVL